MDQSLGSESPNKTNNEGKNLLKKKWFQIMIALDFVVVILLIYFFAIFPRQEIQNLEKGYVLTRINQEGQANYSLSGKKPNSWVSLNQISKVAAHAIVVSEDWAFFQHSGVDVGQVKEAVTEALEGERTRGASTISQQVIKNIFLTKEKTLSRKVTEVLYTTYMEKHVSKDKILEVYLNIAEFAPGVYGIKAASEHYFKKKPSQLSAREGAFLAMLLPSPKRYSQSFREKKLTDYADQTVNQILDKMVVANYLPKEKLEHAKKDAFHWEAPALEKAKEEIKKTTFKSPSKRKARAKKKRDLTGKSLEASYKVDDSLHLDENPEFDEDAIGEDLSTIDNEFSVQ